MLESDSFVEWKENQNITATKIEEKDELLWDLYNIENSWTGRLDAQLANTFIMEATQLICNSVKLYELGYFDCAYYSLRQSLEIATTMIYLSDIPDELREEKIKAWKQTKDFPMQGQMLSYLKNNGYQFSDMKEKLSDYFNQLEIYNKQLHKIVHKQGLNYFYVYRNHFLNKGKKNNGDKKEIEQFLFYLKICIGAVAVMRLGIDPYPILLMDEEIYCRTFDSMTQAYTDEFIEKYIGKDVIDNYRKTEVFINHYEGIMNEEKKLPCVVDLVKYQYIDKENMDLILSQVHLLDKIDLSAALLTLMCEKTAKLYCIGGLHFFTTNLKTKRKKMSWSSEDFKAFSESEIKYNQKYDEAYISVVNIFGEVFFIEHNVRLTKKEIKDLEYNIEFISSGLK